MTASHSIGGAGRVLTTPSSSSTIHHHPFHSTSSQASITYPTTSAPTTSNPHSIVPPPIHANRRLSVRCRLSRATYLAGETVHGLVVVTSYVEQPAERITVRVHGHARVDSRWLPDIALARPPGSTTSSPPPSSSTSSSSVISSLLRYLPLGSISTPSKTTIDDSSSSATSIDKSRRHSTTTSFLPSSSQQQQQQQQQGGALDGLLPAFPDLHQENLACIFTTPPYCLTRSRTPLAPAQQLTYRFRVTLPDRLIPSYNRGTAARFFYMATIAVGQTRYEHIPIAILASGFTDGSTMPPSNYVAIGILEAEELHSKIVGPQEAEDIYGEGGTDGDETGLVDKGFCWKRFSAKYLRNEGEEVIPHSYDSEDEDGQPGGGDDVYMAGLALHRRGYPPSNNNNQSGKGHYPSSSAFSLLNNHRFSNQRTHATIYSIRNGQAHLGRFVTYSREYQPGEPLDGVFDFSAGKLRCYQVSACLIREEWSYYPVAAKRRLIARAVVDTFYEYASNCLSCAVFLKVPIDAPASFETPFTALEWKVCFEFVTGQEADADDEEEKEEQQQGRKHIGEERTANDGEEVAQAVAVHEEEEERPRSGQPQQVTPEITSKLRWVFPVRIVPPLDADATDLFLDHGVQKCSTELHV